MLPRGRVRSDVGEDFCHRMGKKTPTIGSGGTSPRPMRWMQVQRDSSPPHLPRPPRPSKTWTLIHTPKAHLESVEIVQCEHKEPARLISKRKGGLAVGHIGESVHPRPVGGVGAAEACHTAAVCRAQQRHHRAA